MADPTLTAEQYAQIYREKYTPEQLQQLELAHTKAFWQHGFLRYKDHSGQKKIGELMDRVKSRAFFLLCSRRFGKSYKLLSLAFEQAIRHPGSRILYLAATAKDAQMIAVDLAVKLLADCPKELQPEYSKVDKEWSFKNGSLIRLKGVNGEHADNIRGGEAHLIILDECAFMDNLMTVYLSVCRPMTMTTKGRILFASTPPMTPTHESADIYEKLASEGHTAKYTLLDAPHIDDEEKYAALLECGEAPERIPGILAGKLAPKTTTARREYFCEFVTDADSAVVPEYDGDAELEMLREWQRPPVFDAYVAMDPGVIDKTGILFSYVDFLNHKLIIEDEALLGNADAGTANIIKVLREKEENLWGYQEPYLRVSDVDHRLINDMRLAGIKFQPAQKDDSEAAIKLMRHMVHQRQIIINPRCVNLNRQLHNAVWNNKATDFARPKNKRSKDGHYDLVAALKYLCRSINWHRNPYPAGWFDIGGRGGPPAGTFPSRKKAKPNAILGPDTPLARRLAKARGRTR